MNVNGKYGMVFHNTKDGNTWYTLSDSTKDKDGNYHNYNWRVRFKGNIPEDRSKIQYSGFMSYFTKDDKKYVTLQIMEWAYMEQTKQEQTQEKFDPFASASAIELGDDELPF